MQRQTEYNKQVEVDRRLSISKREATRTAVCSRKDLQYSSECKSLNLTGREAKKVLAHLEITTGLTNRLLIKEI